MFIFFTRNFFKQQQAITNDEIRIESLITKLEAFNKEAKFKHAYKSRCANLINLCRAKQKKIVLPLDTFLKNDFYFSRFTTKKRKTEDKDSRAPEEKVNGDEGDLSDMRKNIKKKKKK